MPYCLIIINERDMDVVLTDLTIYLELIKSYSSDHDGRTERLSAMSFHTQHENVMPMRYCQSNSRVKYSSMELSDLDCSCKLHPMIDVDGRDTYPMMYRLRAGHQPLHMLRAIEVTEREQL